MEWFRTILRRRKVASNRARNGIFPDNNSFEFASEPQNESDSLPVTQKKRFFSFLINRKTTVMHSSLYNLLEDESDQTDESESLTSHLCSASLNAQPTAKLSDPFEGMSSVSTREPKAARGLETVFQRINRVKQDKELEGQEKELESQDEELESVDQMPSYKRKGSPKLQRMSDRLQVNTLRVRQNKASVHDLSPNLRSMYSKKYYQRRNAVCEQLEYRMYCNGINLKRLRNELIKKCALCEMSWQTL